MEFFESLKQGRYGSLELNRLVGPTLFQAFGFAVLIHFLAVVSPMAYNSLFFHPMTVDDSGHGMIYLDPPPLQPLQPKQLIIDEPPPIVQPITSAVQLVAVDSELVVADKKEMADQKAYRDFYTNKSNQFERETEGAPLIVSNQLPEAEDPIPDDRIFQPVEIRPQPLYAVCPQPAFPELAKIARVPGKVTVKVYVDKFGTVKKYSIVTADPKNLGFEEEVLKVIPLWKFTPAIQDKKAVGVWVTFPIRFTLK